MIGAGPTGLACAIEAQKLGLSALLIDKGCVVNSIYHYPANMTFFTTPELLEIGGIPFTSPYEKPTRQEALRDYRQVTDTFGFAIEFGERVTAVARRMADEQQIDLAQIRGSGPGGRITKADIETYVREREAGQAVAAQPQPPVAEPGPSPIRATPAGDRREERIKLSRRRRTIARRLVEAHQTAAMLTTFNEIDMSAVIEIRQQRKETFKERHGVGLGFMSFFVKASIGALKAFPQLNAELDGDELIVKHYYDIGMAVGAEEGLVVPVLRDAERMTFAGIERKIAATQREIYSSLTPWQKVQIARHPRRPYALDYVGLLC